jgi:hypothetical protein
MESNCDLARSIARSSSLTRAMLYEAAQAMLLRSAKWSWLKAWAMQIAKRRGMKRAIVALVFESHDGRAYVPIPERSTSPRVTSTPLPWTV